MAKRQFQLTDKEIENLKGYEKRVWRIADLKRLQAVRLYGSSHEVADILDMVGCGESSLRLWVQQYQQLGLESLLAQYANSSQNARKLSVEQEADLCEKLQQYRPDQVLSVQACYGTGQFWTVEDVKTVVALWYEVSYADKGSYRQLLHRCGFSYQRSEQIYKSRPADAVIADFEAELEKK
jgi:transposase